MGLLADIFSTADTAKRRLSGLLSDPLGTLALGVTRFGEDQGGLLNMTQNAYPMAGNKTVLNSPQQIANFRQQVADKGAEMAMQAATVWHGSPHKFDKFDSSKIGTGEGAQAYGHGLYLAEKKDVSLPYMKPAYRDMVGASIDGKPVNSLNLSYDQYTGARAADRAGGIPQAIEKYTSEVNDALARGDKRYAEAMQEVLDSVKALPGQTMQRSEDAAKELFSGHNGSLYKVDLPDEHIAKMLDWDKPLSQQPNIRGMIPKELEDVLSTSKDMPWTYGKKADDMTGQDLIRSMAALKGTYAGASDVIKDAGIPGIRYLDGGSRGAGAGSSNFVIFPGNEGLLQILERNGQALK